MHAGLSGIEYCTGHIFVRIPELMTGAQRIEVVSKSTNPILRPFPASPNLLHLRHLSCFTLCSLVVSSRNRRRSQRIRPCRSRIYAPIHEFISSPGYPVLRHNSLHKKLRVLMKRRMEAHSRGVFKSSGNKQKMSSRGHANRQPCNRHRGR